MNTTLFRSVSHSAAGITLLVAVVLLPVTVFALELNANAGLDSEYTSDAALQVVGEQDDIINTVNLGVSVSRRDAPAVFSVNSSLRSLHYIRNTFDDTQYLKLDADGSWQTLNGRVVWNLQNKFTQQRINALDPDVPVNLQDINVFSFGPQITIPVEQRQDVIVTPQYRRTYYEVSAADNRQYSVDVNWLYRMRKAFSLLANINYSDVRYDTVAADFTSATASLGFGGRFSRSEYDISFGTTDISRDTGSEQQGSTFDLNWLFRASNTSSLSLNLASRFSEAASAFLVAATTDGFSDIADQQITTGAVRNKSASLSYSKNWKRLNLSLRVQKRSLDYTSGVADRDIRLAGLVASWKHNKRLNSSLSLQLNQTELLDGSRDDDIRTVTFNMQYRLSRTLNGTLRLRARKRDSSDINSEYDEKSVFVGLRYNWR